MNGNAPDAWSINNLIMGGWALGGSIARGMNDWRDPVTGQFVWWRMLAGLVTAVILGEVAIGTTAYFHVDPAVTGALAAVLGYLGPAVTMGFITRKFGGQDANPDNKPKP